MSNEVLKRIDKLEKEITSLKKTWYKPTMINVGVCVALFSAFWAISEARHADQAEKFAIRYKSIFELVNAKHELAKSEINKVDAVLDVHMNSNHEK